MEEQQQLPMNEGDCWAELSPSMTGMESNPKVAFLRQLLAVANTRGDLAYMQNLTHDLTLTLLQGNSFGEAAIMSKAELSLRQRITAARKQQEMKQQGVQQQLNVTVKDGKLSVDQLRADQVNDVHDNENVNLKE